jgi:hypothetical protein
MGMSGLDDDGISRRLSVKRWVLVTVLLYVLASSVLVTAPLILLGGDDRDSIWAFYGWFLPVLGLIQAALLLIPAKVARERPVARRTALFSALVGAIPMAALLLVFVYCVLLMLLGEDGVDPFFPTIPTLFGVVGIWILWGALFFKGYTPENPEALTGRITRWLLRGSILELLVAVPAHIISRQRGECCAPGLTLFGLATGISVAVLAFGPGVFFLLARRIGEKRKGRA